MNSSWNEAVTPMATGRQHTPTLPAMTTRRLAGCIALFVAAATVASTHSGGRPIVGYRFQYAGHGSATASIEIALAAPLAEARALVMPRAIPMGYGEQRYDSFVNDVRATTADGRTLTPAREEGPRWALPAGTAARQLPVDLRQMERDITRRVGPVARARRVPRRARLLGLRLRGRLESRSPRRCASPGPDGWPVFSTLAPAWPVTAVAVEASAPDFYALADGQIVMGPRMVVRRLTETPVPLYLATYSEGSSISIAWAAWPPLRFSGWPTTSARAVHALHDAPGAAHAAHRRSTSTA